MQDFSGRFEKKNRHDCGKCVKNACLGESRCCPGHVSRAVSRGSGRTAGRLSRGRDTPNTQPLRILQPMNVPGGPWRPLEALGSPWRPLARLEAPKKKPSTNLGLRLQGSRLQEPARACRGLQGPGPPQGLGPWVWGIKGHCVYLAHWGAGSRAVPPDVREEPGGALYVHSP